MKALLIEFNGATGGRPAGIKANDPKLNCWGWQQLNADRVRALGYTAKFAPPASLCLEIRVIEDDRGIAQYEGREAEGLKVLYEDTEIQAAIEQYCKPMYAIAEETLFKTHLEQRNIKLDDVPGRGAAEQLEYLKTQGIKGISEIRRPTLEGMYGPKKTRKARGLPE